MDETNPIRYSDLLQPDSSFEDLLKLLDELGSRYSALQSTIKSSADAIKQSLQSVSSATQQGQAVIANAAKESAKLAQKERELANVYTEAGKALIRKSQEVNKARRITKLEQQQAESAKGSYNQLYAQYALLKEEIKSLGTAEESQIKRREELEAQASRLYKQMKILQEATGKHTLSVGDYGVATVNLAADIRRAVQALTQMRLEGQQGSEQYNRLVQDLKRLKTEYSIVKTETQSLGSQTSKLNQVMGALTSTSGALTAVTGLMDDSTSDWGQALLKVNKYIAVTNGLMAFVQGLYKQSWITNLLMNQQKRMETRLRAANIVMLKSETKATWLQVAAQAALNLVAKANPYVLLGGIILGIAAGFALLGNNTKKAAKELKDYNTGLKAQLDYLGRIRAGWDQDTDLRVKSAERRKKALEDEESSLLDLWNAENEVLAVRSVGLAHNEDLYKQELKNLDANREILDYYSRELKALQDLQAAGAKGKDKITIGYYNETDAVLFPELSVADIFKLDKNQIKVKLDDAVDIIQSYLDTYQAKIDVAVDLKKAREDLMAESHTLTSEYRKIRRQLKDTELTERQNANIANAKLIQERFNKEVEIAKLENAEEIRLLRQRLERDKNLTVDAREYINSQIVALEKQLNIDLANIAYERRKANITATRSTEDLAAKAEKDGFEKRRKQIIQSYQRELEDIQNELKYNHTLTIQEREELGKQELLIERAKEKELSDVYHEEMIDILSTVRETEDLIIDAKADSYAKQLEQLETQNKREKEDLQDRLDFEALTPGQREAIIAKMAALDKQYAKERKDIEKQLYEALLDNEKALWDNRLDILNEYTQDYLDAAIKIISINKQLEISQFNTQADTLGLSDEQRQAGLKAITDKYQHQELTSKKDHMMKLFDLDQKLAESEFNIIQRSEYAKASFTRKQEIARYKEILRLDKEFGNQLTEQERQIIENRIRALENQPPTYEDFYDLIGIPSEWEDLLSDWVDKVTEAYQQIIDARMELAEAQVSAAQEEVEMTKSALDAELQARANGYASNVALARKEFEDAKKREREALEFKRKVEKEQEAIDTITQISSLVTATANFWSTSSKLGPIAGPIAAALATATMWGAFAIAKIKANQLKNEAATYGGGTVELLHGGSHASGHDISLGYTKDGKERKAEGGEYFAIINKRNSRKYGRTIEDVINAFNTGNFEKEFKRASVPTPVPYVDYADKGNSMLITSLYNGIKDFSKEHGRSNGTDISRLESDVSALRKQMERREYIEADGTRVIITGNTTRRIKNG